MADDTLDCPPFPLLRWDDGFWSGEIALPSWAGFRTDEGRRARGDGIAWVDVTCSDDAGRTRPTPEQAAAFRHLIDHEAEVATAVGLALVEHYPGEEDGGDEDEDDEITEPAGLVSLVELARVHVLAVAQGGAAYLGFEFDCAWDEEHGAGVLTHLGRVVAAGHADVSFLEWVAELDAAKQDRPG